MTKDLKDILQSNLYDYQSAVNEDRALPDSKTGLKPVHTRILYGCIDGGYTSNKEAKKCARIVGDVMGKFHPHGDSSIYEALVRMAQDWKTRYPLIDFHGNKGNIDGDGPAAMRYTNARLSKLAEEGLLNNLNKNNVDFKPNYDEDDKEPVTLPAIFPNILCNSIEGIGWAMACNWLPHNLNEVANAIYDYMDGKEPMLPGPDFPTGCQIINAKDLKKCYETGKGTVKFRARYRTDKNKIIFYEIPFGLTTEGLIEDIKLVAKEEIPEIKSITNENEIVIECAKGTNLDLIATKLYNKTNLQTTESFNQIALVNGKPKLLNLKETIKIYINHNIECICKEATFDLQKDKDRLHIIEGLLKALEDIDNIIALIKASKDSNAAKLALIEKYKFSEVQAKAILDMKLAKLANLEKIELEQEGAELNEEIQYINNLLASTEMQMSDLRFRLSNLVKKYGDARRTELSNIEIPKEEKEIAEVIPEDVVVVVSQSGNVKRIPTKNFKVQKRNGKGIKNEDEATLSAISTNTIDALMLFSNKGKMFRLLINNIPEGTMTSRGVNLSTILKMDVDEKIIAVNSLYHNSKAKYVVFFTKQGLIKKSSLDEYTSCKKNTGIVALKLKENDSLANVTFLNEEDIILITKNGHSIHFATKDIASIGRTASGVKAINLNTNDEVLIGLPIHSNNDTLAVITDNGLGKRINLKEFTTQTRGGKGNKISEYTIAGAAMLDDTDQLLIIGKPNNICINAKDIPVLSKNSLGNQLVKGSTVTKIVKF